MVVRQLVTARGSILGLPQSKEDLVRGKWRVNSAVRRGLSKEEGGVRSPFGPCTPPLIFKVLERNSAWPGQTFEYQPNGAPTIAFV